MHPCACIPRALNPSQAVIELLSSYKEAVACCARYASQSYNALSARTNIAPDYLYSHDKTRHGFGPATNSHRQACFAVPVQHRISQVTTARPSSRPLRQHRHISRISHPYVTSTLQGGHQEEVSYPQSLISPPFL